ncbi:hypothetical protein [Streptomyces fradiae]|uniref:hypothetical protein n=1 Tax=Streptomyces fradiae TaxID=1906 RepID=UPI0039881D8F
MILATPVDRRGYCRARRRSRRSSIWLRRRIARLTAGDPRQTNAASWRRPAVAVGELFDDLAPPDYEVASHAGHTPICMLVGLQSGLPRRRLRQMVRGRQVRGVGFGAGSGFANGVSSTPGGTGRAAGGGVLQERGLQQASAPRRAFLEGISRMSIQPARIPLIACFQTGLRRRVVVYGCDFPVSWLSAPQ